MQNLQNFFRISEIVKLLKMISRSSLKLRKKLRDFIISYGESV